MTGWFARNAQAVQAVSAALSVLVTMGAVVAVKVQIDAADHQARAQSARDIYREHLSLSVANPDFVAPNDGCVLLASPRGPGYIAFVDHLLYTAEQVTEIDESWAPVFADMLTAHDDLLCATPLAPQGYTDAVADLLRQHSTHCPPEPSCG